MPRSSSFIHSHLPLILALGASACVDAELELDALELETDEGEHAEFRSLVASESEVIQASYDNLIANPSFEFEASPQWLSWNTQEPATRTSAQARIGHHSVEIDDPSNAVASGVVSQRIPAVAGQVYTATAWAMRDTSSAVTLYLQFHDGLGAGSSDRIEAHTQSIALSANEWRAGRVSAVAPPGARYVDVLVYSSKSAVGRAYIDDLSLVTHRDLLVNGSFDDFETSASLPGWLPLGDTQPTRTASPRFDGSRSAQWTDNSSLSAGGLSTERFTVYPGQQLTVRARAHEGATLPSLYLRYYDAEQGGARVFSTSTGFVDVDASDWAHASISAEVPAGVRSAELLAYSCMACTGSYTVDAVEVLSSGNLLLDGDAEQPGRNEWSGDVLTTTAESVHGSRALLLEDFATDDAAGIRSQPLPVIPGQRYTLSGAILADETDGMPASQDCSAWLAVEFYPSTQRASSMSQRVSPNGLHIAPPTVELGCAEHGGQWVPRHLEVEAPEGAYAAKVLVYSTIANRGRYFADGLRFGERVDDERPHLRFAGPAATGDGSGLDAHNLALYNDDDLWDAIEAELAARPVELVFDSDLYPMHGADDRLDVSAAAQNAHALTLRGEDALGPVFVHATDSDDLDDGIDLEYDTQITLTGFGDLHLRDLAFDGLARPASDYATSGYRVGYSLEVREAAGAELRNVSFYDIHGTQYGGFGPHNDSSDVLVRDSYFARLGYDSHAHFSYCANDVAGLSFIGNRFEDVMGEYVRARNNCEQRAVLRNRFQSTGTWFNGHVAAQSSARSYKNPPFVSWAIFNDGAAASGSHSCPAVDANGNAGANVTVKERDPCGDEWLGPMSAQIETNRFEYLLPNPQGNGDPDRRRYPIAVVHSGLDPSSGCGAVDLDTLALIDETQLSAALAQTHLGVDPNDWIRVYANDYVGTLPDHAELKVSTAHYDFFNRDTQTCDSSRYYAQDYYQTFYIDDLLEQP